MSSSEDVAIDGRCAFAAEVGLSGEVRAVNRVEARIAEADKLGFDKIFVSKYSVKGLDTSKYKIKVVPITTIGQLFKELFS